MMLNDSTKLYIEEKNKQERKESNESYAIKKVEQIVFGMIAVITLAVLGYLLKSIGL